MVVDDKLKYGVKRLPIILFLVTGCLFLHSLSLYADEVQAYLTQETPVIDGETDIIWNYYNGISINHMLYDEEYDKTDVNAHFKLFWKGDSVYLILEIIDDTLAYLEDKVYLCFDFRGQPDSVRILRMRLGSNGYDYYPSYNDFETNNPLILSPFLIAQSANTSTGIYRFEVAFDIRDFGIESIEPDFAVGFNIEIHDIDDLNHDGKVMVWSAPSDPGNRFQSLNYGQIIFRDTPPPLQITYVKQDVISVLRYSGYIDITITGGTPPYSVKWSNGSTSEDLYNIGEGTYIVFVEDTEGQRVSDTITIFDKRPNIAFSNSIAICPVLDGQIDDIWDLSKKYTLEKTSNEGSGSNTTAYFRTVYQDGMLYLLVVVNDQGQTGNTDFSLEQNDHVSFHFDWGNEKLDDAYDCNDIAITYFWEHPDSVRFIQKINEEILYENIPYSFFSEHSDGYSKRILEAAFDIEEWGGAPENYINFEIGFDIEVYDAGFSTDNDTTRLFWNAVNINGQEYSSEYGIILVNNGITISFEVTECSDEYADDGAIDITVHGGKPPFVYYWNTGDTTKNISGIPCGTYNLIVADDFGNIESITINVGYENTNPDDACSVKGQIFAGGIPATYTMVALYALEDNSFRLIRTQSTNQSGFYHFQDVENDTYLIYAIPGENDMSFFLPTYYVHHLDWSMAHPITVSGHAFQVDIDLISKPLRSDDEGFVSGYVFYENGQSENVDITIGSSVVIGERQPAEDIPVFLQTNNEIIGWTMSSDEGYFEFSHLQYDRYEIIAQKPGYEMAHTAGFTLTENSSQQEDVVIIIGNDEINSWLPKKQVELNAFPVPASDFIYLDFEETIYNDFLITIYNTEGEKVATENYSGAFLDKIYLLDIYNLIPGSYYATLNSKIRNGYFKFVKIQY